MKLLMLAAYSRVALAYYGSALANVHPLHDDYVFLSDRVKFHRERWAAFLGRA